MQVVGIEPSHSGIEAARELVPEARFYEMSAYDDVNIEESDFDIAVSTEVVEHLYSPAAIPLLASAKLKCGGFLIISTPYHGYLKNLALAITNKWDSHHSPARDGGHIKFWSGRTLSAMLATCGSQTIELHGVGRFAFFWKSMILVARKTAEGER